jgi:hypothetical protein
VPAFVPDMSLLGMAWLGAAVLLLAGVALSLRAWWWASARVAAAQRDRSVLVEACVEVSDVVPSAALCEQLVDALAAAGVTQIEVAADEPFDASRHRAVGRAGTCDGAAENLVARTERPGYVDRGRRLRYPEVIVYDTDRRTA